MSDKATAFAQTLRKQLDPNAVGWQQTVDAFLRIREMASTFSPKIRRKCFAVEQVPVELYCPREDTDTCILFLHGGFYWLPVVDFYRSVAQHLAQCSGCNVLLVDYATQPYVYPSALNQVRAVWSWLTAQVPHVRLFGDSSGAQLALSLLLSLRDEGAPLPESLALVSPQADLAARGDSYFDNFYLDVVLGCRLLGGLDIPDAVRLSPLAAHFVGLDPISPQVSPLAADLSGLPPCYVAVGEREVLLSDATCLVDKWQQGGGRCHLTVGNGMFHAYPLYFDKCPESKTEMQSIASFLAGSV